MSGTSQRLWMALNTFFSFLLAHCEKLLRERKSRKFTDSTSPVSFGYTEAYQFWISPGSVIASTMPLHSLLLLTQLEEKWFNRLCLWAFLSWNTFQWWQEQFKTFKSLKDAVCVCVAFFHATQKTYFNHFCSLKIIKPQNSIFLKSTHKLWKHFESVYRLTEESQSSSC